MKTIVTTDLSREGNDCYIYESVSIIEEFGSYAVLVCTKLVGTAFSEGPAEYKTKLCSVNYEEACEAYKNIGGIL